MSADVLISRLEKVKQTGRDSWIGCCPAHEDHTPSMTVRELADGQVLVHCFAGCSVESILAAVGLEFDALFPEKAIERARPQRRQFNCCDVLEVLVDEAWIVAVAASNVRNGVPLSDEDHERLMLAASRIMDARSKALG